ncbi:hypothetical protein SUF15_09930 [Streptococcus agalactiae]|uniref:hypothetical protein n=1 Tax=Streptococcus agalactiae TaxID=1311 RepID=UPI001374C73B|nr:hypothetical protein [Streptococcus agalactiae]KAF1260931.1 hypothetical protein B8V75_04015 [Streptococcus agalactiae]KAF1271418.1 hypothetical protein B8V71_02705 [Streptococcus agalactiae]
MKYIIFSFETGDYLSDENGHLIVFESQGLACQYLQRHCHLVMPISKTKKFTNYPPFYAAPYRFHQVS